MKKVMYDEGWEDGGKAEQTNPRYFRERRFNQYIFCECGAQLYIPEFTNECEKCQRYYNSFGQELKPPDEWEENESDDY